MYIVILGKWTNPNQKLIEIFKYLKYIYIYKLAQEYVKIDKIIYSSYTGTL